MAHQPEKRRSPRYAFIAEAEFTEFQSGAQFKAQVTEISLNGCYIDILNTLPVETLLKLKILAEAECFEATAKIAYAHLGLGMGLAFQEVSIKSGVILRGWLAKAASSPA